MPKLWTQRNQERQQHFQKINPKIKKKSDTKVSEGP